MRVAVIFCLVTFLCAGQNEFENAFAKAGTASRNDLVLSFEDSQNNKTTLPISILKGKEEGPVFTIVAGVHGYEYPPIIAVQQLLSEIDVAKLKGTLIVIPLANTGSFYTRTPFRNPQDKVNLNGAMPGKKDGTVTQKIAHFITNSIIPKSDIFLDIHCGGAAEDLLPFVCYYDNKNYPDKTAQTKMLSEASGFDHVVSYAFTLKEHDPAKYVFKQACKDGKVVLSFESGKLGNVQADAVARNRDGVYRILQVLNMYPKIVDEASPEFTTLNNQKYLSAEEQGIFYSDLKAGDKVTKGQEVGYITNEFGKVKSRLKAPASGVILYKISTPPVNIDDTLMCISFKE